MSKIKLHYTPEQLIEINGLTRDRLIMEIKGKGILRDLPSDQIENVIRIMNNYFDDINTILNEGVWDVWIFFNTYGKRVVLVGLGEPL